MSPVTTERQCADCGQPFTPRLARSRFCSARCRKHFNDAARSERHREQMARAAQAATGLRLPVRRGRPPKGGYRDPLTPEQEQAWWAERSAQRQRVELGCWACGERWTEPTRPVGRVRCPRCRSVAAFVEDQAA